MMLFVIYEAAVGNTSLPLEGVMVPVGSGCKNGSLADLANHQHLHHMQHNFTTVVTIVTLLQLLHCSMQATTVATTHVERSQVSTT